VSQGDYTVTYAQGTFSIIGFASLWICDHADAGDGKVHLAFCPKLTKGDLTAAMVLELAEAGRIKVASAMTEESLAMATPVAVPLRDPTAQLDIAKGWVWVTVDLTANPGFKQLLWKVVIDGQ